MREWLLDFLDCEKVDVRVSARDRLTGGVFSGIVLCDGRKYYIKRGILSAIKAPKAKHIARLKGLYESLPPAPWLAKESDYVKHMRKAHLALLRRGLEAARVRSPKVLSVGCGWGWEIWAMMRMSPSGVYVGVDVARKPLKFARRIAIRNGLENVDFVVASIDALPFKSGIFDIVTAIFGPMDHIENPARALAEVRRVLKPRGVFIFTVLNKFSLDWIAKVVLNPKLFMKTVRKAREYFTRVTVPLPSGGSVRIPTHYYTPLEIGYLLKKFGFREVWKIGIFSILPLNFRRNKFTKLSSMLACLEEILRETWPYRLLGRYLGFVTEKSI